MTNSPQGKLTGKNETYEGNEKEEEEVREKEVRPRREQTLINIEGEM